MSKMSLSDEWPQPTKRRGHHCPSQRHLRRPLRCGGLPGSLWSQRQRPRQPRLVHATHCHVSAKLFFFFFLLFLSRDLQNFPATCQFLFSSSSNFFGATGRRCTAPALATTATCVSSWWGTEPLLWPWLRATAPPPPRSVTRMPSAMRSVRASWGVRRVQLNTQVTHFSNSVNRKMIVCQWCCCLLLCACSGKHLVGCSLGKKSF